MSNSSVDHRRKAVVTADHEKPERPDRRRFLMRSAAAGTGLAAIGTTGIGSVALAADGAQADDTSKLPAAARRKDEGAMILHGENPITLETSRSAVTTSGITPSSRLFIRNNLPVPDEKIVADRDAWEVTIDGVKKPRTISLRELKTMGLTSVAMVLQCAGNGRGFFEHEASGSQWRTGASGNVVWSGVPLKNVVEALGGPADGMKYLTSTGGEVLPEGLDPDRIKVERSIPLEKALDDVLLAWEMNGEPIPLVHGGPLRVIVPGYYGCNNTKYAKRVAFTVEQSTSNMQQSSYRMRPIGESSSPDQPTAWEMNVKSWVTGPGADADEGVQAGRQVIYGVAFGGYEPVESVEVTTDGGKNWQKAELYGPDLGRYAWRNFRLEVDLSAGNHVFASRATNGSGETQPEQRVENERGYMNNSWRDHALTVVVI